MALFPTGNPFSQKRGLKKIAKNSEKRGKRKYSKQILFSVIPGHTESWGLGFTFLRTYKILFDISPKLSLDAKLFTVGCFTKWEGSSEGPQKPTV